MYILALSAFSPESEKQNHKYALADIKDTSMMQHIGQEDE